MIERYRQMDLATASPVEIVEKLYAGALRHTREAAEHLAAGRIAERARSLSKALAIVAELQGSLDLDKGGEIAANLDGLYGFVSDRLVSANLEGSRQALDEATRVLATLHEAWQHIAAGAGTIPGAPA